MEGRPPRVTSYRRDKDGDISAEAQADRTSASRDPAPRTDRCRDDTAQKTREDQDERDMPRRNASAFEIQQMEKARLHLMVMSECIAVAFRKDPSLAFLISTEFKYLTLECEELLEEMKKTYNPRVEVSNRPKKLEDFDDETLRERFRFGRAELKELMELLEIPLCFRAGSGRVFYGEECFLLMLRRLAAGENGVQLATIFDRSPPAISEMHNAALDHVFQFAEEAMRVEIWEEDLQHFADSLDRNGFPLKNCCGYVETAMFDICRPLVGHELTYNEGNGGHKIKYQCVILPNLLIGDWYGPAGGNTENSTMLSDSGLTERIETLQASTGQHICLCAETDFPPCAVLQRPPERCDQPQKAELRTEMSKYREKAKVVLDEIGQLWPFIADKSRKIIGSRATGKEDFVAALLTNFHTCAYGSIAGGPCDIPPPSMRAYKSRFARRRHA